MKTLITFFGIILFSGSLFGQKFVQEWYIDLPGLQYFSQANAIISTHDDHLFIAGQNNNPPTIGSIFFMETDTSGNVIQLTSAEEQFSNTAQVPNGLIENRDNNFVMVGNYSDFTYFTRLSSEGEVLNTTMDGSQTTYRGGYDVEQTLDGGYLVTAYNAIYESGRCLALRKLDATGHFIWDMTFLHPDNVTPIVGYFSRMDKINDSTFVITGSRNYAPGGAADGDVLLCKIRVFNNSIQMLNLSIFEQNGTNEKGHDILVLPDN